MHPMFVKLFIETDADDLLAEEEEVKRRRARRSGRNRPVIAAAKRPQRHDRMVAGPGMRRC